ncbi:hypothetical protein BC938DRAFT_481749, partial [Jimgerdemannia flammicorona]
MFQNCPRKSMSKSSKKLIIAHAASLTNLEDLPKSTVAIVIEIRNNQTIKKEDILRTVADFIPSHCKVQLTNPDFVILVSVFKSMCGLSIIPDYYRHRKY